MKNPLHLKVQICAFAILLCSQLNAQNLNWSFYVGTAGDEHAEDLVVDTKGNIIICLSTDSGGLATPGAFQTAPNGQKDFLVAKYRQDGTPVWATYFGGNSSDFAYAITADLNDNIYVCGKTVSSTGIASPGAAQETYGGGTDGILVKFDSSGNRLWSTFYGGPKREQDLTVVTDDSGNVYVGGYTESTTGIATEGAWQTTYGGGKGDGFIQKYDADGVLKWASYYGGTGQDRFHCLVIDHAGNIVSQGTTPSDNGITTPGVLEPTNNGSSDAFIAKWRTNGTLVWSTFWGGNRIERGRKCCVDDSDNIYVTGYTQSDSGLATHRAYQRFRTPGYDESTNFQCYDTYISKFTTNGRLVWSTYYGGEKSEWPQSICWRNGVLAISGLTNSTTLIATPDAWQPTIGDEQDAYLALFSDDGALLWSTYCGGSNSESLEGGYSPNAVFDNDGNMVLIMNTMSDDLPSSNLFNYPTTNSDGMLLSISNSFATRNANVPQPGVSLGLSVYPNPVSDKVTCLIQSDEASDATLQVSNMEGHVVFSQQLFPGKGTNSYPLDVHELPAGIYVLTYKQGGKQTMVKLMKQ